MNTHYRITYVIEYAAEQYMDIVFDLNAVNMEAARVEAAERFKAIEQPNYDVQAMKSEEVEEDTRDLYDYHEVKQDEGLSGTINEYKEDIETKDGKAAGFDLHPEFILKMDGRRFSSLRLFFMQQFENQCKPWHAGITEACAVGDYDALAMHKDRLSRLSELDRIINKLAQSGA